MSGIVYFAFGLILAVPLSVAANLLTPRIQKWWAVTSRERSRKRLEAITKETQTQFPTLATEEGASEVYFLFWALLSVLALFSAGVGFLVVGYIAQARDLLPDYFKGVLKMPPLVSAILLWLGVLAVGAASGLATVGAAFSRQTLRLFSSSYWQERIEEIEKLKAKLGVEKPQPQTGKAESEPRT